jgi:hypothetical protein
LKNETEEKIEKKIFFFQCYFDKKNWGLDRLVTLKSRNEILILDKMRPYAERSFYIQFKVAN